MDKYKPHEGKDHLIINRLAIVMKELRITNRHLASKIGYEETTVSKWVTNAVQPPITTFLRIALVLERDLPDLFISTKNITEEERTIKLRLLETIAESSKRTGKKRVK